MLPLLGQIIRLVKSIHLHPHAAAQRPSAQFIAGKHPTCGFPTGIGLNWWYSADTFFARESVASLLIQHSPEFRDCDLKTVSDVVMRTLQETCVDPSAFNADEVAFAQRPTLFDCISVPVPQCADSILGEMARNLRAAIGRCCTVYAVPRLISESFCLRDVGIHVIARKDADAWQGLIDEGFILDGWKPTDPRLSFRQDRTFSPNGDFESVLVADCHGTKKGTRFSSVLKFRVLLAVTLAVAEKVRTHAFFKAAASPLKFCVQFPHESNPDRTLIRNDCAPLVPYYAGDIPLGQDEITEIRDWYAKCAQCGPDTRNRIEKAAHFLNLGMNADGTEAYINYFVTLDALLGQRGSVEASILAGLSALGLGASQIEKARWLFELRSEIVHGGSRYVEEWSKYARYVRHFHTNPMRDVQTLAQLSVLQAPHVLSGLTHVCGGGAG